LKIVKIVIALVLFVQIILLTACSDAPTPKPRAYFRIAIPEHNYIDLDENYPYSFQYADYAKVLNANNSQHPYWMYIDYPYFKARIYLTYNDIHNDVNKMVNDAHDLAYKHISVANDIRQDLIIIPENKVYGLIYEIKGARVASPINFFLTDSVSHFVRGSLYFNMEPQNDSLEPVINAIGSDIQQMIKSFKWKDNVEK
jgi:gliding motility-associated lipoprotein GldD